ncbi:MAG TPA: tautomerase family protein [Enteractinococcus sp.]
MPHIAVSMFPGRDDATKRDIAEKLQQFYVETFGTDQKAVSVSIVEIPGEEFRETIQQRYRPEELYISSRAIPSYEGDSPSH